MQQVQQLITTNSAAKLIIAMERTGHVLVQSKCDDE